MRKKITLIFVFVTFLFAAIAPAQQKSETACPPPVEPPTPSEEITTMYAAALKDAMNPEQSETTTRLTPILNPGGGLFNTEGQVLLSTWTKCKYYSMYQPGDSITLVGDTWFTVVPEIKAFCKKIPPQDLQLRLQQRIGLPPTDMENAFVEVWVNLEDLFRPCPDPEIYDRECVVRIPMAANTPSQKGQPPWPLPQVQQGAAFMDVSEDHLDWMYQNWVGSYTNPQLFDNFPWTALGYTYDWAPGTDHIGASEYVVLAGHKVVFHSMTLTADYCASN